MGYTIISVKHLERYAMEFAGRHNARPLDTMDQMGYAVKAMAGKRLKYAALIGSKETRLNRQ